MRPRSMIDKKKQEAFLKKTNKSACISNKTLTSIKRVPDTKKYKQNILDE